MDARTPLPRLARWVARLQPQLGEDLPDAWSGPSLVGRVVASRPLFVSRSLRGIFRVTWGVAAEWPNADLQDFPYAFRPFQIPAPPSNASLCALACVTRLPGGTLRVSHTLPPMVEP